MESARPSTAWITLPVVSVLVLGLALTFVSAARVASVQADARASTLREGAEQLRVSMQDHIDRRTAVQRLLRDSIESRWPIDRRMFWEMTSPPEPRGAFEGVQAVAFARRLDASQRDSFEAAVRADTSLRPEGYPDFEVFPPTSPHDDLVVVEFIEPLTGNDAAFGFDMASNLLRRAAIERARDSGALAATEPVDLVTSAGQDARGVLLVSPVYDTAEALVSGPSRRRHFVGVVVTVLTVDALAGDVPAGQPTVDVEVYDLGLVTESRRDRLDQVSEVLDADPDGGELVRPDGSVEPGTERLDLDVGGRRWSLVAASADDGSPLGVLAVVAIGLLGTAAVVGILVGSAIARRRAEELAQSRTADLRQVLAAAPDATVVVSADGRIVVASEQVRTLLGYEPQELVGKDVEALVPQDSRARHARFRAAFTATTAAHVVGRERPIDARRADGSTVPVEVSIAGLPETTTIGAVVASLRDVSVQRQAIADLQRANDMKTTFLSTVSHELRTPLTAIRGFSNLLLRTPHAAGELEMIERIAANAESLRALIDEVLDFSRLARQSLEVDGEDGDLRELVEDVVDGMRPLLEDHDVRIDGDAHVGVHVDPSALQRILANLLTNATRYAPDGSVVAIGVRSVDGVAELVVDDEGPGIPAEDRAHVFETFWRGEAARATSVQGTGVGLAVVAQLVTLSGGSVCAEDSPAGGARLRVRLPSSQAASPTTAMPRRPSPYSSIDTA